MVDDESRKRRDAGLAAVLIAGERGYSRVTVDDIAEAVGISRESFDKLFPGKAECFTWGYATVIEGLDEELARICRKEPDLASKTLGVLERLAAKLTAEPALARGLLIEVHLAGAAALRKRDEFLGWFVHALEEARAEALHAPPPATATFLVGAVEAAAIRSIREEDPSAFANAIPELMFIAMSLYLGREAAEAAYRGLRPP